MKLIQAVVDPDSIRRVQEELNRAGVFRLTIGDVETIEQSGMPAAGFSWSVRPAVRLEIAVNESFVKPTLDALFRALKEDDEKSTVYVLPLKDAIRIRTGERGPEAI